VIIWRRPHLHPRGGGETLEYVLAKLFGREVAVLEQCTGLDLNIANGAKFLHQGAERVKRTDGLRETRKFSEKIGKLKGGLT
jgi:hypothetical protein